jgi:hypothetical protein
MPLPQNAQKCAWCGGYLWRYQSIAVYDGSNLDYIGWLCHTNCNIEPESESESEPESEPESESESESESDTNI